MLSLNNIEIKFIFENYHFMSIYLKMIVSKTYIQNKYTLMYTLVLLDITKSYSRLYVETHSLNYQLAWQKYTY